MTSIAKRAREEQEKHFAEHPEMADSQVTAITRRLYDAVDSMDENQRTLLARDVLGRLHSLVFQTVEQFPQTAGIAQVASALTGIGGYAVEVQREEDGYTSTSDRVVDEVLADVSALLHASAAAQFGEDAVDSMDAIAEQVKTRVQGGEDFDAVVRDELAKAGITHNHPVPTADEGSTPNRYDDSGLYL